MVRADFALEGFDRPGFGTQGFVIPTLDGRTAKDDPITRNGMAPLLGGQFLKLGLQVAVVGRRRQERADDTETKMRPTFMGSRLG